MKSVDEAVEEWFELARYSEEHARQNLPRRPWDLSSQMRNWLQNQLILGAEFANNQPYPGWNPRGQNARKVAEKVAGYYKEALSDIRPRAISNLQGALWNQDIPELEGMDDKQQKRFYKRISDSFPTTEDPGTLFRIYQKIYHDPYTAMQKIVKPGQNLAQGSWPVRTAWNEVVSQRDGGWNKLSETQQKELIDRMVAIEMDRTYRLTATHSKKPILDFDELLVHVKAQAETPYDVENALKFIDKQSTELATLDKKANKSWFRKFLRKLPFFSAGFVGALFPYDEAQAAFNRGILRKQGVLEPWRPEGGKKSRGDASLEDIVEEAAQLSRILFGDINDPQAEFKTLLIVETFRTFDPGLELVELASEAPGALMSLVKWVAIKTPLTATDLITKALGREYRSGPQTQDIEDYPELGQTPSWAHGDEGEEGEIGPVPLKEDLQEMKTIFENWRKWK